MVEDEIDQIAGLLEKLLAIGPPGGVDGGLDETLTLARCSGEMRRLRR